MNTTVKTCVISALLIPSLSYADYINLGKIEPDTVAKTYSTLSQSLENAMVGIPGELLQSGEDYFGYYKDIKTLEFKSGSTAPTVVYMHGSGQAFDHSGKSPKLKWNYEYANWIVDANYIFIAPDSHKIKGRPTFSSPVPKRFYEEVHTIRQAEIAQAASSLLMKNFVNKDEMYLMGVSEGALASARYAGKEFKGRMVLSWSCEPGYFTDYAKVGATKSTPFLNIMGHQDFYFGRNAPYNTNYIGNSGNCANYLSMAGFKNAKVITYPESGHGVSYNQYIESDLLNFLKHWVGRNTSETP